MKFITAAESVEGKLTKYKKYEIVSAKGTLYEIVTDSGKRDIFNESWFFDSSNVNHPAHYGGKDNPYEAIKIIEHFDLSFCLGNTLKYILRAGKKMNRNTSKTLRKQSGILKEK